MQLEQNEKIKFIRSYEGLYSITSLGRVWSHRRKKWLKPALQTNGYEQVTLWIKGKEVSFTIHKLVAGAFITNPHNKPHINHKNGDKMDSRALNLEWVTPRENSQHACDMGLNSHYKLSGKDKLLICQIYGAVPITKTKLANMFDMSPAGIGYIIREYSPIVGNA